MRTVHFLLPAGADDPARPSGGNTYDRRLHSELVARGWEVRVHPISGSWPEVDAATERTVADALAAIPDRAAVLVDGLYRESTAFRDAAGRLRLVLLLHSGDLADPGPWREIVVPSEWARTRVGTAAVVAPPGTDPADPAPLRDGRALLSVGAVTPVKGQDVLVAALGKLADLDWRCSLVGPLDRDPSFAAAVRSDVGAHGLGDRILVRGTLDPAGVAKAYDESDLLVVPSRSETYGLVVTEALARALPVVATAVGGLPEALGSTPGGRPGILVAPDDPGELAASLREWLTDADRRQELRRAAQQRRSTLPGWTATAAVVERVLEAVAS